MTGTLQKVYEKKFFLGVSALNYRFFFVKKFYLQKMGLQ